MNILNLLSNISTGFIDGVIVEEIGMTNLNWMGKIVQWLIEGIGIVGLGVIVFTLILKTIVLPLDIYSRVKMKKQALLMETLRPQMEKLQKQYENDKNMYNQKVMELQKKNGYSMFGACIPMIVSLVIFMYVFSSFSTYSQYANLSTYNDMVKEYNTSVQTFILTEDNTEGFLIEATDNSLINPEDPEKVTYAYYVDYDAFKTYYTNDVQTEKQALPDNFDTLTEAEKNVYVKNYVKIDARIKAAAYYEDHTNDFLWVKNLWYPDSMLNKEVPTFSKFSSAITRAVGSSVDSAYEESYNEVTYNLSKQKDTYNGYFILIILAIGIMFLQQFIMMRTQKATNELSTVDGTGARTNKMMMVAMPIIYGIFSFFYSAAFSLYMITNTLYGLVTTLIINKATEVSFAKHGDEIIAGKKAKSAKNRKRLK